MNQTAPSILSGHPGTSDPLRACVHCGLCLQSCPTYRLSGDENNSPRGRLHLWRAVAEERVTDIEGVDAYTDQCVGCLACESVCPANVPYGDLLEHAREEQVTTGRGKRNWKIQLAARMVQNNPRFQRVTAPARILRNLNLLKHPMVFPGQPAVLQSSAAYAQKLVERHQPNGPTVALMTGCLMEGVFREINFATIEALIASGIRVVIPENQGCCGAMHHHTGLPGSKTLSNANRSAFTAAGAERVLTNSAGCGLALGKSMEGTDIPVQDVLQFLGEQDLPKPTTHRPKTTKLFVDLPCHLIHGQKVDGIPASVLDATGYVWELAPGARDCCGSGGVYNIEQPANATEILRSKSAFLDALPNDIDPIIVTANHVCMMQWQAAKKLVRRPFNVRHVVQLLPTQSWLNTL
jgi:glycolate oxidase iron-sulfur subunit